MQSVYLQMAEAVIDEVKKVVIGKDECIVKVMAAIIAGGHILLDDIPGVGKTTMALAFSRAMELKQNRVQFTPDVLPADIVGFSMYDKGKGQFVYQPGAVMCNLFLADEINRTSPKTQSALLEVMEEGGVTVDGVTKAVPEPFIVLATQNPVGSAGTQMLPESQVDRFMVCLTMGYPQPEDEITILKGRASGDPLAEVQKVMNARSLMEARREAEQIYVHQAIYKYMVRLVNKTRENEMIELGISPRGTIALASMAKSCAWLRGRKFVYPDDVADVFYDVAIHRIRLNARARINHVTSAGLIEQILKETERPTVRRKKP
ncbi:MAG: AAA family ATPase [Coprococcus sp.]